jgi:hypothetical protein
LQEEPNQSDPVSRVKVIATVVLDGLFMVIWAAVQFAANWVIQRILPVSTSDQIVLWVLQGLFGVTTLVAGQSRLKSR